jgi:predicted phage tail protein
MSVKIIAELHPFKSEKIKIEVSPKQIAEIIKELNSGFPLSQARVCRNGEIVTDFSLSAKDGDTLWIKFVPYGNNPQDAGAVMKFSGWALMVAGAFVSIIFGWTGIGGGIGIALIGTGLSMAFGGTVLMNTNVPTFKDREKPENDPSIRGGKNQLRQHGRIPVLFGRHRIYPDLAANQHTEIIENQQYLTQLFCGGYKDYIIDLDSVKLGETLITELSQTKNIQQILAGLDPVIRLEILQNGEASNIYPRCVHEDVVNAPLQNRIDGGDGNKISGEIIRTTPDNTDAINVDIFFHNGLGRYDDEGELQPASVTIRVRFKPANAPDSSYQNLGFFNGSTNTISGSELKTRRFQITRSGLERGQYTVKIERLTADSTESKTIDHVHIGSIRSYKSNRPIRAERQKDLTIIAMRVMATAKLNGVIDSLNYVAVSKLPVHSSGGSGPLYWLNSTETCNPASMLLYSLRGRAAQQPVDFDNIDWHSLEEFYVWCEERNYACNAYLSESVTIAELIRMIGNTSRADILRIDSKISVVQDIERTSPVQLFTPKNTISYSITMFKADTPDAISLRYIDEEAGFTQNELMVYNTPDGNRVNEPDSIQKADLWGITNSIQARRIGMYNYACLKNRPFVHTIDVDIEYLMCNKGDWIQYAGDIALTGSVQGRVIKTFWNEQINRYTGIQLDEPIEMKTGLQYAVRIRLSNGTVLLKDIALVNEPNEVYFTEPLDADNAPKEGDIYAFGVRGQEVLDLIINDIQPGQNLSAMLTCVEYSPEIFKVDNPNFILPEFENKITPVSGAVDSGVVNPNRWRVFVVYNDSDHEPQRPAGDGQNNGWHYAQTLHSVWQSAKTAESVDQGEWGPPVRIRNVRDNNDVIPVWLALSKNNIILECDNDGNIIQGLLPLTLQANIFKWNVRISARSGIVRFPGIQGNLFDPMLGGFYPHANIIEFSLIDAPEGVKINKDGLITVSYNAKLEDENSITVKAVYEGGIYTAVFFIRRDTRRFPARYLGTITTLPNTAAVFIITGPVQGQVRARQGDYVLAVADGPTWRAGRVYQWTGIAWEFRSPDNHADLYIRCFKDGLDVPELTKDMGWFGALFARLIVAQQAFIEELQAQHITLKNGGIIQSSNWNPGSSGFIIKANGDAEFNNAVFRGLLAAREIIATGTVSSGTAFLLRASSLPAEVSAAGGWISAGYEGLMKEVRTLASGSCLLRMSFPRVAPARIGDINIGYIRVEVNGATLSGWNRYFIDTRHGGINIDIPNIILVSGINTIRLFAFPYIGGNAAPPFSVINTLFELRCAQDPGFLGVLG